VYTTWSYFQFDHHHHQRYIEGDQSIKIGHRNHKPGDKMSTKLATVYESKASVRIDWVSFSVKVGLSENWKSNHMNLLDYLSVIAPDIDLNAADVSPIKGRPPYKTITTKDGFSLLEHHLVPHALIEIEGHACARLGQSAVMAILANETVAKGLTRLDIALDIETATMPADIYKAGWGDRWETHSFVDSPTGQTLYVGSPKSDRMCRVYKYAEPHERAHLLRFEYVLRRREAKKALRFMQDNQLIDLLGILQNIFGWKHPEACQYTIDDRLPKLPNDRASIGSLLWLAKQVLPAIERLESQNRIPDTLWSRIEALAAIHRQKRDNEGRDVRGLKWGDDNGDDWRIGF
jgi:hypothetical protein